MYDHLGTEKDTEHLFGSRLRSCGSHPMRLSLPGKLEARWENLALKNVEQLILVALLRRFS